MRKILLAICVAAALLAAPDAKALTAGTEPVVQAPAQLGGLLEATGGNLAVGRQPATGAYGLVRATHGAVLAPGSAATPELTARSFLSAHGHVVGMSSEEMAQVVHAPRADAPFAGGSELAFVDAETDKTTGLTRARFDQIFAGLPVFGGRVTVHIGRAGITAVNGVFVPAIDIAPPAFDQAAAEGIALTYAAAELGHDDHDDHEAGVEAEAPTWAVHATTAQVYNDGLVTLRPAPSRLVWAVELVEEHGSQQIMVDAVTGAVITAIDLWHAAKDRCVYTPAYVNPTGNDELAVRDEGDPATLAPPVDQLYDYSGQVYDLFSNVFGRDSWDGKGHKMRTVYDTTAVCPNAYWDGTQKIARFCPGFDLDDVVAHEWGHAYTQATHGLIYKNQPGALNESYSDIWGEVVDLTNGVDGVGGSDNDNPSPVGQRWIVGEDLLEVGAALGLRDMYNPESRKQPSKVSSKSYVCGTGDNGGVHTNSAVPNHAFAMLVDGKTFNGHTVGAIGMTKASHIYFQAMVSYQTPTSGFVEHASALRASCADLTGVTLNPIPGDAPGQVITASDCSQVDAAIAATEMEEPPVACGRPVLEQGAPAPCPDGSTLFAEDWETGTDGWTIEHTAVDPNRYGGFDFAASSDLPDRSGSAAFARASRASACPAATVAGNRVYTTTANNPAGVVSITSPEITAAGSTTLRFDHYVATEEKDGGNVLVSVNGGAFVEVPTDAYLHNAPKTVLPAANPKARQRAWSGPDAGLLTGSWGTSVADLSALVAPGDTFRLRFEEGQDCAGGLTGWYIDDVAVLSCPSTTPPTLALGAGYSDPDPDGAYALEWTRPEGATGPDTLEEGAFSAPVFADDAESGLGKWVTTAEAGAFEWRTSSKPGHIGTTFWAQGNEAATGTSSLLTTAAPIAVPSLGEPTLSWKDWAFNHAGDKTVVEVSEDGATWTQLFQRSTPFVIGAGEVGWASEALTARSASLVDFAGKSVFVRFRFTHGPEIYINVTRFGWYVDDISLTTLTWSNLATVSGTSYAVTGRDPGTYLYRVTTTYGTYPSRLSNVVSARVS